MAVNSYDSTTGRPIFTDNGAPDIAVDPTAVGIYAAEVGNRIVKANLAELNAYPYRRPGLAGHALDTKTDYVILSGTAWTKVFFSAGGVVSAGTNGSGVVQVTHNMGKAPISVSATMSTTGASIPSRLKAQIGSITATSFDAQVLRSDSNDAPLANNPVVFYWTAVA